MVQEIKQKRKKYGGCTLKPFEEKKVHIWGTVKRKYYKEAMLAVNELLKQWK